MIISFTQIAFEDYQNWSKNDKLIFKKINTLIKEILRTPFTGTGKPEPLKHELSGYWSRRINDEHRLVYKVEEDEVLVISCMYHYK
ncbi:MAG: Txe/YoeB family addiction module toxin [Treponema sp.]|nr:Txe/YoeB family addiction module toxin [Treponema sp.]MBR0099216.1 Txe/YoeB family addiction module toxin [Treponema sp.]